jgi:uncharacterized protein (UPF0212 family)
VIHYCPQCGAHIDPYLVAAQMAKDLQSAKK